MRILYHHRTLGDGAEGIHIAEMVSAFEHLGHDVELRGLAVADRPAQRGLVQRLRAAMPGAAFECAAAASNVLEYANLRRAIAAARPDFMYKRHARYDVGALVAARHAGIPTVLEVNCLFTGADYRRFEPPAFDALARRFERRALRLADVVLAVSTPLAREINQLAGVSPVVMPNGVDPEEFDPDRANPDRVRRRYGLANRLTLGWAGVLRDWHGLEMLLDALAGLPEAQLLIVGDGPARGSVERQAAALGVTDRLVITGRVAHREMPDHLAAMDIAVVASDGTGVASPMKLLEYMAMRLAVVAPALDNIRDVIAEGSEGLLFDPGAACGLLDVLRRLSADASLRRQLGTHARLKTQTTRSWRRNAEDVLACVGNLAVETVSGSRRMHAGHSRHRSTGWFL